MSKERLRSMCRGSTYEKLDGLMNNFSVVIVCGSGAMDAAKELLEYTSMRSQIAVWENAEEWSLMEVYMKRNVVTVKANSMIAPDSDRVDLIVNLKCKDAVNIMNNSNAKSIVAVENANWALIDAASKKCDSGNAMFIQTGDFAGSGHISTVGVIERDGNSIKVTTLM